VTMRVDEKGRGLAAVCRKVGFTAMRPHGSWSWAEPGAARRRLQPPAAGPWRSVSPARQGNARVPHAFAIWRTRLSAGPNVCAPRCAGDACSRRRKQAHGLFAHDQHAPRQMGLRDGEAHQARRVVWCDGSERGARRADREAVDAARSSRSTTRSCRAATCTGPTPTTWRGWSSSPSSAPSGARTPAPPTTGWAAATPTSSSRRCSTARCAGARCTWCRT
jgi:hypothetical protein